MFWQEVMTCVTVAGATAGFTVWGNQQGVERQRVTAGAMFFACGLLTLLLMVLKGSVLAQVMLLIPGVVCVGESRDVVRGSFAARKRALASTVAILVLALPVIGLYSFAVLLILASAGALIVFEAGRRAGRRAAAPRYSAEPQAANALAVESCY